MFKCERLIMCSKYQCLITLITILISVCNSARILAYIPTPSYSHQSVYRPLWRELSLRGHKVVLLTTNPVHDSSLTNLTEIDLSFTYKWVDEYLSKIIRTDSISSYVYYMDMFILSVDMHLQYPPVKKLLQDTSESFDLFIGEFHINAAFVLAEKFRCPSIGISSLSATDITLEKFGNPINPVAYPQFFMPFEKAETISQRISSVLFSLVIKLVDQFYLTSSQDALIRKHFGEDFPSSTVIGNKVSLLFENCNPVFDIPRPRVPAAISVSGIYKVPVEPLATDLKNILDSSTNGCIYFSLGSHLKSSSMTQQFIQTLLDTFSELPYTIFWKFESDQLPNKPKNVHILKWFPQAELLKHHNIKLFITHGGLQSIEDSISAHVPMVGVPFVADQPRNIKRLVDRGMGLAIDHAILNKEDFKKAIFEVINNPKYRNRVKQIYDLIEDQPMTGLERAVWWVEYVIRHKGATHLRSAGLDIPWYQYYFLDIIIVFLIVFSIFVYLLKLTIHSIAKILKYTLFNTSSKKKQ